MAKTSVVVPSRNERFAVKTIDDLFAKAKGEIEVIAVLEGYWPDGWAAVTQRHPNLHTIHHSEPKGMRPSINEAVASAVSRKTRYILKTDAHCMFDEGFDEKLKANMDPRWVVIPRRKRLDAENWTLQLGKPDIDYHYLSFPDDPADFGGAGLNGKVWEQRALERSDPKYDIDEEMSSQGSCWFMSADYFYELELMDDANYGTFWNEMQEIGLKTWLGGGQLMINKKTWYAHLHKGRHNIAADGRTGRGYHLDERQLKKGRNHTMKWLYNEAWSKQTLPFKTLIERFWPVPGWAEDWEEKVYGNHHPAIITVPIVGNPRAMELNEQQEKDHLRRIGKSQLVIHAATYGLGRGLGPDADLDVTQRLQSLVTNDSLDIIVNNSTLCPNQNPYRGKRKKLLVTYSYDGGKPITVERQEKEWLIIGPAQAEVERLREKEIPVFGFGPEPELVPKLVAKGSGKAGNELYRVKLEPQLPMTATALNDLLIRRFNIADRRLRAPMPVELRDFHRNDLAKLFAELGFTKGVEVGVAEGHYSEVLAKSIPNLELLCVDPWTRYSGNPWAHSQQHQDFSKSETERKLKGYNATLIQDYSMNAVRDIPENSLDFAYIDGHHGFDWVMQDLIEWGKRVRPGGIISGDDYYHFKRYWGGVVEAVNAYTGAHKVPLWFICQAPQSIDFWWVKL